MRLAADRATPLKAGSGDNCPAIPLPLRLSKRCILAVEMELILAGGHIGHGR